MEECSGWLGTRCRSKKAGVLGIKNLEMFSVALLTKWKWQTLVDTNAIWRDLLLHRYADFASAFLHGSVEASGRGSLGLLCWCDLLNLDSPYNPASWFQNCVKRGLGER